MQTKDVPELLSSIAQHTEIKNNYASLSESLLAESDSLKQQVTRLELEIKQVQADLEALWEGLPPVAEYELSSVFMHRGPSITLPCHGHTHTELKPVVFLEWQAPRALDTIG